MPINYALAKTEAPKLKAALTRAMKRDNAEARYVDVRAACKRAVERWEVWGAWPDNWALWQRALDDAAYKLRHWSHYQDVATAVPTINPTLSSLVGE